MPQRHTKTLILLIISFYFAYDTEANLWRRGRRRRSCSASDCQMSSWSSWSSCSAPCGHLSSQQRTRYVTTHASCGGSCPYSTQETKSCYGTAVVDCAYSLWSQWSTCAALHCEQHQSSRRYIITREKCGGTPCNMTALRRTRLCHQTFCVNYGTLLNGKCLCKPSFYGSCCQYNRK